MSVFREIPAAFTKGFWEKAPDKQLEIVTDTVYRGLCKAEPGTASVTRRAVAEQVGEIRAEGIKKVEDAVKLLAAASKGYLPDGPRGQRSVLLSIASVSKTCGVTQEKEYLRFARAIRDIYGGLAYLVESYTASNFKRFPSIKFSSEDLARGIVLPEHPKECSDLLGIIAADGRWNKQRSINLTGRENQEEFYKRDVAPLIEKCLNYPGRFIRVKSKGGTRYLAQKRTVFDESYTPLISIGSSAFYQWMSSYFRGNLEQALLKYFSGRKVDKISRMRFVYGYLAAKISIYANYGKGHSGEVFGQLATPGEQATQLLTRAGIEWGHTGRHILIGSRELEKHWEGISAINPQLKPKYESLCKKHITAARSRGRQEP